MSTVRVAAAQFYSGTDVEANLAVCRQWIADAAAEGAQIVVLPENCNRVRDYADREACWEHAHTLDDDFVGGLRAAAAEHGLHVVAGVDLRGAERPDVHISSLLIAPDGSLVGVHRKHFLWDYEYTLFVPGTDGFRVFDTALGRIALIICADGIVPEPARCMAVQGVDLFCNSLNSRGPDEMRVHIPLRALESGAWMVASNTVGGPLDAYPWTGGSQVVGPDGQVVALASESADELIVADIDLAASGAPASVGRSLARRRPELYGLLTTPTDELAPMADPAAGGPATVRAALMQLSRYHSSAWTVRRAIAQLEYAADQGADVGVLPELFAFAPGEVAADPAEAAVASEQVLVELREGARRTQTAVATSLVERDGDRFFHTAYLIGRDGQDLLRYRKTHLTGDEAGWATPGDRIEVADTPLGRVGLMIGDETWLPEVGRVLALQGAEIVLHPCSWTEASEALQAATERVEENRFHLVSATRLDNPAGLGSQAVVATAWNPLAPIALPRFPTAYTTRFGFEEQIVVALDRAGAHDKRLGAHVDVIRDRFPECYGALTAESTVGAA
jgi:predicted amidohydrolase